MENLNIEDRNSKIEDKESKIIGIDQIDIITNGSIDDIKMIKNPNQIGKVIDEKTNDEKFEITPIFMIINQGLKDFKDRLDILIENGGDMDLIIHHPHKSANELMKFRH
jgi:hypothetical protein